ncbi:MAG: GNAT family N-acetyltransferase [Acidobacteria bacterium]|nr:GNAT family N-acetyltransferase [Acidobacteriota bacterium]
MQSTVEIKLLGAGDEAILQSVATEVFDDPIHPNAAAEFLSDPRHHIAVAVEKNFVIGFVSAVHYLHPDKPSPEWWINEVGVAESHRGQGIARRLMKVVLDEAQQQGCGEAWVLTHRSNVAAMRLYASSGGSEAEDADIVMFEFNL